MICQARFHMPSKNSEPTPSATATIANIATTAQKDQPLMYGTFAKIAARNTTLTTCTMTVPTIMIQKSLSYSSSERRCAPSSRT